MIYPDMIMSLFVFIVYYFFFFKQKTAYEMRISDWSSDVCSSDLSGMDMGDMSMRDFSNAPEVAKNPGVQTISPMPMDRSEEHTSELQSLMRISYAVFCLKKKTQHKKVTSTM